MFNQLFGKYKITKKFSYCFIVYQYIYSVQLNIQTRFIYRKLKKKKKKRRNRKVRILSKKFNPNLFFYFSQQRLIMYNGSVFFNNNSIRQFYSKMLFRLSLKKDNNNLSLVRSTYFDYRHTNLTPILFLSTQFVKKHFYAIGDVTFEEATKYYQYYYQNFLEYYFNLKVHSRILTNVNLFNYQTETEQYIYLSKIVKKNYRQQFVLGTGFYMLEMIFLLWYSLKFRDFSMYVLWFQRTMEKLSFKKHRKACRLFFLILKRNSNFFLFNNKIKGFFFHIKGKLGVQGNSKKRKYSFRFGKTSTTLKNSHYQMYQSIINTQTGVLGFSIIFLF